MLSTPSQQTEQKYFEMSSSPWQYTAMMWHVSFFQLCFCGLTAAQSKRTRKNILQYFECFLFFSLEDFSSNYLIYKYRYIQQLHVINNTCFWHVFSFQLIVTALLRYTGEALENTDKN